MKKFIQPTSRHMSQWIRMASKTQIGCCDCGLVHEWSFKLIQKKDGQHLYFKCRRHKGATQRARKKLPSR